MLFLSCKTFQDTFILKDKDLEQAYDKMLEWINKQQFGVLETEKDKFVKFRYGGYGAESRVGKSNAYPVIFTQYIITISKNLNNVDLTGTLYIEEFDSRDFNKVLTNFYGVIVELVMELGGEVSEDQKRKYVTPQYRRRAFVRSMRWSPAWIPLLLLTILLFNDHHDYVNVIGLSFFSLLVLFALIEIRSGYMRYKKLG